MGCFGSRLGQPIERGVEALETSFAAQDLHGLEHAESDRLAG
jgi:hypothetical protein